MTQQPKEPGGYRTAARIAVAAALAAGAGALAHAGGAPWGAALPFAAGAATFAAWRSVPGACTAFAFMFAAALVALESGPLDLGRLRPLLPALVALEVLGPLTIAAVAWVRRPRRVSRRLLGAWLASSGLVLLAIALCTRNSAGTAGSVLLVGGLAYRLGVVPAYAWVPMLLRHPSRRIAAIGALAAALAAAVLAAAAGAVPDRPAATATLAALALPTVPWAVWQAVHQWRRDRPCARTYGFVAVAAVLVLASCAWWWLHR